MSWRPDDWAAVGFDQGRKESGLEESTLWWLFPAFGKPMAKKN